MLTRKELIRYVDVIGFNLWQVEKDYLQHLILMLLFGKSGSEKLVLKGGTALQKAFGLNRFSLDLDFTFNNKVDVEDILGKVVDDVSLFGYRSMIFSVKRTEVSRTITIKINGPLYTGTEPSVSTIRVEVSLREKVILKPVVREIVPVYMDLRPYLAVIMHPEEILAEKVRALMYRARARDLYDLWFLLRREVEPRRWLIEEKLRYYGLKFNIEQLFKRIEIIESIWYSELKPLVKFLPSFSEVRDEVVRRISLI